MSNIERAEFRILYSDARNKLDSFSRCRNVVGRPAVKLQTDAQIELQKKFANLQQNAANGRFSNDQQLLDLEIQLKDHNPQTEMEDNTVRCARLSAFALSDKADVANALDRAEAFIDKY